MSKPRRQSGSRQGTSLYRVFGGSWKDKVEAYRTLLPRGRVSLVQVLRRSLPWVFRRSVEVSVNVTTTPLHKFSMDLVYDLFLDLYSPGAKSLTTGHRSLSQGRDPSTLSGTTLASGTENRVESRHKRLQRT